MASNTTYQCHSDQAQQPADHQSQFQTTLMQRFLYNPRNSLLTLKPFKGFIICFGLCSIHAPHTDDHANAAYFYVLDFGLFLMLLLKMLIYRRQLLYILHTISSALAVLPMRNLCPHCGMHDMGLLQSTKGGCKPGQCGEFHRIAA